MSASSVLAEVAAERTRQDGKWGEQNHPNGTGYHYAGHVADTAKQLTEGSSGALHCGRRMNGAFGAELVRDLNSLRTFESPGERTIFIHRAPTGSKRHPCSSDARKPVGRQLFAVVRSNRFGTHRPALSTGITLASVPSPTFFPQPCPQACWTDRRSAGQSRAVASDAEVRIQS